MNKIKGFFSIETTINEDLFYKLSKLDEFKGYTPDDFYILYYEVKEERLADEYENYSKTELIVINSTSLYVKNKKTKKIYVIDYTYKADYDRDYYKITKLKETDRDSIRISFIKDKEDALLKIDEGNKDYSLYAYLLNYNNGGKYNSINYSVYMFNIKEMGDFDILKEIEALSLK